MLELAEVSKSYAEVSIFGRVSLRVAAGEFVALVGESGVGKSTLLNCVAGLDDADSGRIVLDGIDVGRLDADDRARLRRTRLGFVFQAFHVLPHLTVAQNVSLPLRLLGRRGQDEGPWEAQVERLLADLGLQGLAQRMPAQLSGGQLQRVAIARALIHRPRLILADEPTGNLDPSTAARVLDALLDQARSRGAACLMVTHSLTAAERADRVLRLTPDGVLPVA